jgi:uncharacterized membrane protein YkvA (DUF1232 family)
MIRLLKLWRIIKKDLHRLWFALVHPRRPSWLVPALGLLALYALDPLNVALPFVGAVDDLVVVPLLLHLLLRCLPAEIRADYAASPDRRERLLRMTKPWAPNG